MATSTYILNNGPASRESTRLDLQHVFFSELTGELLPRSILDHLSMLSSPRIADIGTGTGAWLLELATRLPLTSQLDGFDIDTEKYPTRQELPDNVSLEFGNALEPFPEKHCGSYDFVHVRLMMYALKKDQWEAVARNLKTLLKPGGWLLWEETGYTSWVSLPPSKAINAILDFDIRFAKKAGRDIT
jgi:SAM-dependent methyltransferase